MTDRLSKFDDLTKEKLGTYVYLLIDPRSGQTFYVGKGTGNRVFDHMNGVLEVEDVREGELPANLEQIRQIIAQGLEPIHIIHRHGLTTDQAYAVEAALIDYIPGLANKVKGRDAIRGPANAIHLNERYSRVEMVVEHKLIFVKTSWGTVRERGTIYEAARWAWNAKPEKANRADYVLAIINGVCEGVFANCEWRRLDEGQSEFECTPLPLPLPRNNMNVDNRETRAYLKKLAPEYVRKHGWPYCRYSRNW